MPRVHVINGGVDDGLLAEVFSNEGIGTLVYANDYQQIRRARRSDVRAIEQLIKSSIEKDELAPRTRASIEKELSAYWIFEVDGNPIACVALHPYPAEKKGELACLYVRPSHENQGIGRKLAQFVETKAREAGLDAAARALDPGLQLLPVEGGLRRGHAGRPAARAPRALRAERPALEGAGEEAVALLPQESTPARNSEPKCRVSTALPSNLPWPGVMSISMCSAVPWSAENIDSSLIALAESGTSARCSRPG